MVITINLVFTSNMLYAESSNKSDITSAVSEAGQLLQKEKFGDVIDKLEKAMPTSLNGNEDKDFIGAYAIGYNNLGLAYLHSDKYDKAIEALQKSRDTLPGWPANYYLLGQAYCAAGRFDKSIDNFKKGMELAPGAADINDYSFFMMSYIQTGNNAEAEKVLKMAKERFPQETRGWRVPGAESASSEKTAAVAEKPRSVWHEKPEPESAKAYINAAVAFYRSQDYDKATENFKKALEISPDNAIYHYNLGKTLLMSNKSEEGMAECEKASSLGLDDVNLYRTLGKEYFRKEELEKSLNMYENVKRLDPQDDNAYFMCGVIDIGIKDGWTAREEFKKAIELNPNNVEAHYELGWLYADYEPDYARSELETALKLNPNHGGAKKELERLDKQKK